MGGTLLTGYLASAGNDALIDAAYLISVCWNYIDGSKSLQKGYLNQKFDSYLTKILVSLARRHLHLFERHKEFNVEDLNRVKTVRDFDQNFTRKIFGFESVDHYYQAASHYDKIHLIKVPTVALQAKDDMLALAKGLFKLILDFKSKKSKR